MENPVLMFLTQACCPAQGARAESVVDATSEIPDRGTIIRPPWTCGPCCVRSGVTMWLVALLVHYAMQVAEDVLCGVSLCDSRLSQYTETIGAVVRRRFGRHCGGGAEDWGCRGRVAAGYRPSAVLKS